MLRKKNQDLKALETKFEPVRKAYGELVMAVVKLKSLGKVLYDDLDFKRLLLINEEIDVLLNQNIFKEVEEKFKNNDELSIASDLKKIREHILITEFRSIKFFLSAWKAKTCEIMITKQVPEAFVFKNIKVRKPAYTSNKPIYILNNEGLYFANITEDSSSLKTRLITNEIERLDPLKKIFINRIYIQDAPYVLTLEEQYQISLFTEHDQSGNALEKINALSNLFKTALDKYQLMIKDYKLILSKYKTYLIDQIEEILLKLDITDSKNILIKNSLIKLKQKLPLIGVKNPDKFRLQIAFEIEYETKNLDNHFPIEAEICNFIRFVTTKCSFLDKEDCDIFSEIAGTLLPDNPKLKDDDRLARNLLLIPQILEKAEHTLQKNKPLKIIQPPRIITEDKSQMQIDGKRIRSVTESEYSATTSTTTSGTYTNTFFHKPHTFISESKSQKKSETWHEGSVKEALKIYAESRKIHSRSSHLHPSSSRQHKNPPTLNSPPKPA